MGRKGLHCSCVNAGGSRKVIKEPVPGSSLGNRGRTLLTLVTTHPAVPSGRSDLRCIACGLMMDQACEDPFAPYAGSRSCIVRVISSS